MAVHRPWQEAFYTEDPAKAESAIDFEALADLRGGFPGVGDDGGLALCVHDRFRSCVRGARRTHQQRRLDRECPDVALRVGAYGYFMPVPWESVCTTRYPA